MIAAAVQKTTSSWPSFTISWFDVALVLVIAFGFWRGRKRGMSREALPTAFWLVAVIGAGFGNQPLGDLLQSTGWIRSIFGTNLNEHTVSYVISYLFIVMVAFTIYSFPAKMFREKVSGSNAFGSGEYYLGIISGMVRYACITLFFLALLNAPYYSPADIAATKAYNNRWYGGGLKDYGGNFIPSVADVQDGVFKNSIMGPPIHNYLGAMLIQSAAPSSRAVPRH